MDPLPTVTIGKELGTKNQWARHLLYSRDGKKFSLQTREVIWSTGVSFLLLTVFLVLQGSPDEQPKPQATVESPDVSQGQVSLNVPDAESYKSLPRDKELSKVAGKTQTVRFTGPQLLIRSGTLRIPPGSTIKAVLLTAGTDGLIRAKATEALTVNGETKFDEGVLLLGEGSSSDERLKINFKQLVFQDGTFEAVQAEAFDFSDQMIGLKGSKLKTESLKLATAIGLNFAGGLSEALQDSDVQGGVEIKKPSLKNALLNGTATAALEQSRQMMNSFKDKQSAVSVPPGTKLIIMFEGN